MEEDWDQSEETSQGMEILQQLENIYELFVIRQKNKGGFTTKPVDYNFDDNRRRSI